MSYITIYHNPRCQKSRETLALIEKSKSKAQVIEYLVTPPTAKELQDIINKLGIKAVDLIRKNEALFKEKFEGEMLTDTQWIKVMAKHPVLIERPIVVKGNKAIVGRPPENVLPLL